MSMGAKVAVVVVALLLGGFFLFEGVRLLGDSNSQSQITATTLEGERFDLAARLARGPVLLNFFSTT